MAGRGRGLNKRSIPAVRVYVAACRATGTGGAAGGRLSGPLYDPRQRRRVPWRDSACDASAGGAVTVFSSATRSVRRFWRCWRARLVRRSTGMVSDWRELEEITTRTRSSGACRTRYEGMTVVVVRGWERYELQLDAILTGGVSLLFRGREPRRDPKRDPSAPDGLALIVLCQ